MLKKIKTMDIALVVVAIIIIAFTIKMINVFEEKSMTPDTLITCVFGACTGELGILGWIKTCKTRHEDREWYKEDREYESSKIEK